MSNLFYVSKVTEKVIAARLLSHMQDQNLLDPFQSAYRSGHNTETALLHVHNDILRIIDNGNGVFLVLLNLSTAFDTVDHTHLALISGESHWTEGHSFANVPLLSFRSLTTHLCE